MRRAAVNDGGGFDERLYPNEENELLNRLASRGALLFHPPQMVCRRSQRETLGAVLRQHVRYGRGRARHIAIDQNGFRPALLLPLGVLVSLAVAVASRSPIAAVGSLGYAGSATVASVAIARRMEKPTLGFVSLLGVFPAMHVGYAIGMLWEFAQRVAGRHISLGEPGGDAITIRRVRTLGS